MTLKIRHALAGLSAFGLLATSLPVAAGLGGLGGIGGLVKRAVGGEGTSSADGDAFLNDATRSTKNIMISAAVLSQILTDRNNLAGKKAAVDALSGAQRIEELDAYRTQFQSDMTVLNDRENLASDLSAAYEGGTKEQRKLTALAVANLAIGIVRNTQLVGKASGLVKGLSSNPQLLTRMGQFKMAAGLVAFQGKSLGKIAGAMPKLLTAVKVEMPDQATTTEPEALVL